MRIQDLPERLRVTERDIRRLIVLAWNSGDSSFGCLACLAYEFLLRVANEAVPLECGTPLEAVAKLPEDRHSGLWLDGESVCLKLRSRKHRPQGSLLIRNCNCAGQDGDSRLCPAHSLQHLSPGSPLFPDLSASQAQRKLRRYLTLLQVPGAHTATLKCFRASKATYMADQGRPIHQILAAGEWRCAAILNYANEDSLDRGAVLLQSLEQSDEES